MKFFIDTANVAEIRKANDMGVIAGVTTNPSLIAKEGGIMLKHLPKLPLLLMDPFPARSKPLRKMPKP